MASEQQQQPGGAPGKRRMKVDASRIEAMLPLLKEATDKMREDGVGLETRSAVLNSGFRVEYFRGKDFSRYWTSRPGELAYYLGLAEDDQSAGEKKPEEIQQQMVTLICYCITANLLRTAERKHTKPRPGKKKLSKWPTNLVSAQPAWDEELFYTYTYERPRGVMFYVYAALLLALATFCCFYSIVPNQIKVRRARRAVRAPTRRAPPTDRPAGWAARGPPPPAQLFLAYVSMTLLAGMTGGIGVRSLVFLVWWILSGQSFWILPNLLSDEVPLTECLVPRVSLNKNEDDRSSLLKRGCTVGVIILVVYFLSENGVDQNSVKMMTFKAHDQVLSMLKVQNANLLKIKDVTEDVHSEDFQKGAGGGGGGGGGDGGPDIDMGDDADAGDDAEAGDDAGGSDEDL